LPGARPTANSPAELDGAGGMQVSTEQSGSWASSAGAVLLSALLALAGHSLLYGVRWRIARRSASVVDDALVRHTCGPTRVLLPVFAHFRDHRHPAVPVDGSAVTAPHHPSWAERRGHASGHAPLRSAQGDARGGRELRAT
jgi:hypothetical protein